MKCFKLLDKTIEDLKKNESVSAIRVKDLSCVFR